MQHDTQEHKAKKKLNKWLWFGALPLALIASVSVVAHIMWLNAGTGEWELVDDRDGIKVWTKKVPGSRELLGRGYGTVDAKLAGIMKFMRDPASCDEVGCYDSEIIETVDYPKTVFYTFKYDMFFPFKTRHYVVRSDFQQDPITKEVNVTYAAAPEKLQKPAGDCCLLVTEMENNWHFTPQPDGKVVVEFVLNASPGGAFPYFVYNLGIAPMIHQTYLDLQEALNRDVFKNAHVDYVQELVATDVVVQE